MSVALSPLATSQSNNPALSNQSNRSHKKNNTHSFHKNRIYMELTTQRAIPKDSELSIRYTSAFEVYTFSFDLLSIHFTKYLSMNIFQSNCPAIFI